ncbi:adhesion G-protein coupled receptor G7-like [Xyrauchen texanus]|uniref:adhesion G-protein coupled receptor G7-like n=1 Tax=Xyrauchen texanus TaxID=154827 RepID=UPI002241FE31|nr:adhesion G-protein coupled receptor G7-like [Xyrauchen texanus]
MDCHQLLFFISVVLVCTSLTLINGTTNITTATSNIFNNQTVFPRSITSAHLNTTVPKRCQNGGRLTAGVCLCSDDWSGTTCTKSNFCPEQKGTYTFPKTLLGQFASSKNLCQSGKINAGIPQASALCNTANNSFNFPNILNCDLTLDTINTDVSGASLKDINMLASSTQILTSIPERLTPYNITKAAEIANNLLSTGTPQTKDITLSAVATVSQLLSASPTKYSNSNNVSAATLSAKGLK